MTEKTDNAPEAKEAGMHSLKRARLERLLTQRQLADKAKVSRTTVIAAERGEQVAELSKFRLAKALGMKPEELWPSAPKPEKK